MNPALLLLLALPVFVLGYRYYAKYVALTETVADSGPGARPAGWDLLAQRWVTLSGGTTVVGVVLALLWGWIPAFLWITCGTVLAAGVYGMASHWWSLRDAAEPALRARNTLGAVAGRAPTLFAALLLVTLSGWLVYLAARLLTSFPELALPLLLYLVMATVTGYLSGIRHTYIWLCIPAALAALVLLVPASGASLSVAGDLDLRLGATALLRVDSLSLWAAAALAYALLVQRLPGQRHAGPQALQAATLAAVITAATLVILALGDTPVTAPQFNDPALSRPAIPWLFLVLAGGALAGIHGLLAAIGTSNPAAEQDPRRSGYVPALADGVLALLVLMVCSAGFADPDHWQTAYGQWDPVTQPEVAVDILMTALANLAAAAQLPPRLVVAAWALLLLVLTLTTLEAAIRGLVRLLGEPRDRIPGAAGSRRHWLAILPVVLLVFSDGNGAGATAAWPIMLMANLLLAGLMLATCLVLMGEIRRPGIPLPLPMGLALIAGNWGLFAALIEWGSNGQLGLLVAGCLLLVLEVWWLAVAITGWTRRNPHR